MEIRLAGLEPESIVDGPGYRFTVFVQGCPHNCPGCHNPQTHDFSGGHLADTDDVIAHLGKNPLVRGDFESLLQGKGVILPEHKEVFAAVYARLPKKTTADWADKFGFSGEYMEARIFADLACCKILNRPFSLPETTGCRTPTVGGIYVLPDGGGDYLLTELLQRCGNPARPEKNPLLWSRAAKGWQKSFAAAGENV